MEGYTILLLCSSSLSILIMSTATDSITITQPIRDGRGDTIVSAGGRFELGFFSPAGNSTRRYLGLWYKKISTTTVVWVANREIPLFDSSGVLKVTNQGILQLLNRNETIIWSSNSSRSALNPVALLLESGNLVVRDGNDENPKNFLWQSFDYPCDTLLAGMKHGMNTITGEEWYLSSWKSTNDPSPGDFTYRIDPRGLPQFFLRKGSIEQFRSGPWNGLGFGGNPQNPLYKFYFNLNQKEMYFSYELLDNSVVTRLVLNQYGIIQRFIWIDRTQGWSLYRSAPADNCDNYAICGAYSSCNSGNSPVCGCLKGFVPKLPKDWNFADWSNGCVRRTPLDCRSGDGFIKYSDVKLPDTRSSWFNETMTLEECRKMCSNNCSCMAYANLDIRGGGSGCLLWFGDMIDIREFTENGQEIYIRMASSEIESISDSNKKKRLVTILVTSIISGLLLLGLAFWYIIWKKRTKTIGLEDLDLPLFDLITIAAATHNFCHANMIGAGGFGPVYKGNLSSGQEIAVKRLSKNSRQGLQEFKNEVILIAKLQHRNLVRLLGCCIQGEETMLIYEYMPNKSLDNFIFDQNKSALLTWQKRFDITIGIARGLLYLHQDSRLRIIHRDLKASNILLDSDLNPKISDFGLARIFGVDQIEATTKRVIGTYGYMSPEYAIDGNFSMKSDVFSLGVLLLEIVSGKRNRRFHHPDHHHNLLGHAWLLWNEDKALELMDACLKGSCVKSQVLRCIQVGLLCVQKLPQDRPAMSFVVFMLGNEGAMLPQPKQPGFFIERSSIDTDTALSKDETHTGDAATITILEAR